MRFDTITDMKGVLVLTMALSLSVLGSNAACAENRCDDPCPFRGTFDGANCYLATAPPSSRPFVYRNEFFYSLGADNTTERCPLGGDREGEHCRFGMNPPATHAFVEQGRFYLTSACDEFVRWSAWKTRSTPRGSLAGRAMHRKIQLRWKLDPVMPEQVAAIEVIYGQAGAREDVLQALMPHTFKNELLPWITRGSCQIRRFLDRDSWRPRDEPPICRNGGVHRLEGWASEAWLHGLRTELTYRLEIAVHLTDQPTPRAIGPIFVTTR